MKDFNYKTKVLSPGDSTPFSTSVKYLVIKSSGEGPSTGFILSKGWSLQLLIQISCYSERHRSVLTTYCHVGLVQTFVNYKPFLLGSGQFTVYISISICLISLELIGVSYSIFLNKYNSMHRIGWSRPLYLPEISPPRLPHYL